MQHAFVYKAYLTSIVVCYVRVTITRWVECYNIFLASLKFIIKVCLIPRSHNLSLHVALHKKTEQEVFGFKSCRCLGLRELCSKSSSLFYSEFPQNCIIMLIIIPKIYSLFSTLLSYFFSFSSLLQSKCAAMLCSGLYYIKCICNSLLQ